MVVTSWGIQEEAEVETGGVAEISKHLDDSLPFFLVLVALQIEEEYVRQGMELSS